MYTSLFLSFSHSPSLHRVRAIIIQERLSVRWLKKNRVYACSNTPMTLARL